MTLPRFLRDVSDILRTSLEGAVHGQSLRKLSVLQHQLLEGKPLQVLMGFSEFYDHRFFVNENVLVPRPETEYLVDLILQRESFSRVLDVGVGSGVILLSLLTHSQAMGIGTDLSSQALQVAAINARRLRVSESATFLQVDRLSGVSGTFDLIVSNPPYIKRLGHAGVHASVHQHEPHLALYLEDETYREWFLELFRQILQHLDGTFYMEGHELEVEAQAQDLRELGFQDVTMLPDLSGVPRFLRARYFQRQQS